jgi:hypothetical protein
MREKKDYQTSIGAEIGRERKTAATNVEIEARRAPAQATW